MRQETHPQASPGNVPSGLEYSVTEQNGRGDQRDEGMEQRSGRVLRNRLQPA